MSSTEVEAEPSVDTEQNKPKSSDEDEHVAPADSSDNGGMATENDFAEDEVGPIIEAIASTGTFWTDWDKLKSMLSFKLKQVLSEYPEAKMTAEQQGASLGETYPELVKRLNEALVSFDEGPPFTLQRLCEILLSARSIYPKLSKLALALEKNLLVTSMLKSGSEPREEVVEKESNDLDRVAEEHQLQSNLEENGVDTVMEDRDETMVDLEEVEADGGVNAEDYGEIVEPSESSIDQEADSTSRAKSS